jgi:hypothetical protein
MLIETEIYIAESDSRSIFNVHKKSKNTGGGPLYIGQILISSRGTYCFKTNQEVYITGEEMMEIPDLARQIIENISRQN